jgi:hypothetical protein
MINLSCPNIICSFNDASVSTVTDYKRSSGRERCALNKKCTVVCSHVRDSKIIPKVFSFERGGGLKNFTQHLDLHKSLTLEESLQELKPAQLTLGRNEKKTE